MSDLRFARDLRDPIEVGKRLLERWDVCRKDDRWKLLRFSEVADLASLHVRDYNANLSPHEKYGDPRLLPSTLPN